MHLAELLSKATYSAFRLYIFFSISLCNNTHFINSCIPWEKNQWPSCNNRTNGWHHFEAYSSITISMLAQRSVWLLICRKFIEWQNVLGCYSRLSCSAWEHVLYVSGSQTNLSKEVNLAEVLRYIIKSELNHGFV